MLTLVLALVLALPQGPPPERAAVEEAVRSLAAAFAGKEIEPKVQAVEKARDLADAEVARAIAKGLKEERAVQIAALDALRWMEHPAALEELHAAHAREKALVKDPELLAVLLKSIGQHGSPTSIRVLADDPLGTPHRPVVVARILGLGNVRDPRSVEELIGMLKLTGRAKTQAYADEFRLALCALTGVDRGRSADAWIAWWNEAKRDLVLPPVQPRLTEDMQRRWELYWGLDYQVGRQKRREDRGDDRERD